MVYKYDAFFSYKRDAESDAWHDRVREKLVYWLRFELDQPQVNIFLDREEIHTGARWRSKITEALRTSKCIVCVWSPLYFRSRWCTSEWLSFAERSRRSGRDLVLPASFHDGESFPQQAKEIQMKDFSRFASTIPRFWDTEHAVTFEESLLKPFARDLAAMIRDAPPYDAEFPIIEAEDPATNAPIIQRIANE